MPSVLVVFRALLASIRARALIVFDLVAHGIEASPSVVDGAVELLELLIKLGVSIIESSARDRDPNDTVRQLLADRPWMPQPRQLQPLAYPLPEGGIRALSNQRLLNEIAALRDYLPATERVGRDARLVFEACLQEATRRGLGTAPERSGVAWSITPHTGPALPPDATGQRAGGGRVTAPLPCPFPAERKAREGETVMPWVGDGEREKLTQLLMLHLLSNDALYDITIALQDELCDDPATGRRREAPLTDAHPRYRLLWLHEEECARRGAFGPRQPASGSLWPMQTQPFRSARLQLTDDPSQVAVDRARLCALEWIAEMMRSQPGVPANMKRAYEMLDGTPATPGTIGGDVQALERPGRSGPAEPVVGIAETMHSLPGTFRLTPIDHDRYAIAAAAAMTKPFTDEEPARVWGALEEIWKNRYRKAAEAVLELQRGEQPGQAPQPGQYGIQCPACDRISRVDLPTDGPDMVKLTCKWCMRDIAHLTLEGAAGWEERKGLNRAPEEPPEEPPNETALAELTDEQLAERLLHDTREVALVSDAITTWELERVRAEARRRGLLVPVITQREALKWCDEAGKARPGVTMLLRGKHRPTAIGPDGRVMVLVDPDMLAAHEALAARLREARERGGEDERPGHAARLSAALLVLDELEAKGSAQ